jgi:hypothetical protein
MVIGYSHQIKVTFSTQLFVLSLIKNHKSVRKVAELTIATMHFAWTSVYQAEQYCAVHKLYFTQLKYNEVDYVT